MSDNAYRIECFLCGRSQQHGHHDYNVPFVPSWGVSICRDCRKKNWDGIVPDSHPKLVDHLKARGLLRLNAKGLIDIPGA